MSVIPRSAVPRRFASGAPFSFFSSFSFFCSASQTCSTLSVRCVCQVFLARKERDIFFFALGCRRGAVIYACAAAASTGCSASRVLLGAWGGAATGAKGRSLRVGLRATVMRHKVVSALLIAMWASKPKTLLVPYTPLASQVNGLFAFVPFRLTVARITNAVTRRVRIAR